MWDKRAYLVTVHDGDTITVVLDQGFGDWKRIKVRLLGVFAPELSQPGGPECRAFVQAWMDEQKGPTWPLLVVTSRTADHETQTFDRYVCTVSNLTGTRCLNADVVDFIQANGYGGGVGA